MLFNSAIFVAFLFAVYVSYWFLLRRYRLWLLLVSGALFYGSWDWRFLLLLIFTGCVDFFAARNIQRSSTRSQARRWWGLSLLFNIGTLICFKYYNFFAETFISCMSRFGVTPSFAVLQVVLPLGISFYTFQAIAYVSDVYKGKIKAEESLLRYMAFICFFPQMVAGPIERAKNYYLSSKKTKRGMRIILKVE